MEGDCNNDYGPAATREKLPSASMLAVPMPPESRRSRGVASAFGLAILLAAAAAHAVFPVFGANDVPTVFFINKSDDGNRVDYGIRLDATCSATSDEAVVPYWREFEPPPVHTKELGAFAQMGYGIAAQRAVKRGPAGGDYALRLKQVGRPIGIATRRGANGRCIATARTTIGGVNAELSSIYVKLSSPLSVEYIDIKGRDFRTGKPIVERLKR